MRNKPRIRFKGFTEDWEQCKLGDLTQLITKGTTPKLKNIQNGINFIKVENISDDGVISINSYVSEEEHTNYLSRSILANNDILFSIAGTLGRTAIVKSHLLPANTNQALAIIRLNKSIDVEYINTFLKSNAIKIYIKKNPTVGAQPNLSLGQVSDLEINIPSYGEQNKISNLFSTINLIITLHQRKLEKLNLVKKALLQKLFPKNGSQFPEIRFKGFTDAWEQCKFSDITYLSGIKNKENKPYESYSISNEFGFIPQDEQFENGGTMKTADKSMYYIVSQNSFAYNPARINVGSIGYYDKPDNVIVSSLYEVFKTTDIVSDKFLWHWFKSNQFNRLIEKYQEGGVRLYFYYDKLCKGTIELPTINEQNKISNLLDDLDMYITLHQRKLDKLQEVKKGLLQKMFV